MKKTTYLIAAGILIFAASCKKEAQATPVNSTQQPENCSFCYYDYLGITNPTQIGSTIDSTTYVHETPFMDYNGPLSDFSFLEKSPNGIYGGEGLSLVLDNSSLPMVCVPNKLTFAHARSAGNTNDNPSLVNVKLQGTPLIVTVPDSLNYYLSPYGYSAQHFFQPGVVYRANGQVVFPNGVVDSVIITGPNLSTATIGVNLFESEFRSIRVSHE